MWNYVSDDDAFEAILTIRNFTDIQAVDIGMPTGIDPLSPARSLDSNDDRVKVFPSQSWENIAAIKLCLTGPSAGLLPWLWST